MTDTPVPPTPPPPPSPPGAGRGIKIALGLSLAVNLLIVGVVAGAVLGRTAMLRGDDRAPIALRTLGLGPLTFAMERDDRRALEDRVEAERDRLRPDVRALGGALRQFGAALRAEPFNRDAVAASLADQRGAVLGLQAEGHDLLLDQLEAMGPDARAALADRLQRRIGRRGPDAD